MSSDRDFNSISPSAKGLLVTKALTTIPFAYEAATLIWDADNLNKMFSEKANRESFIWLIHFENRYRTIDTLLSPPETKNILEIASGFSFRGVQLCTEEDLVYIDTDLPESMAIKQLLVKQIKDRNAIQTKGTLLMEPLNALDENEFNRVIDLFPPGPVTIVNEGLLMYLDEPEKRQLCRNIHNVLSQRGGSWITADIYLKKSEEQIDRTSEKAREFLAFHKVEEKKFDSFEAAAAFFSECGFSIAQKEVVAYERLSALRFIQDRNIPEEVIKGWFKRRETWKLVCA